MQLIADSAEMVSFPELANELALVGFTDSEQLSELFQKVDIDKSATLNFSEFLSLLYLWHNVANGSYDAFFRHPANAKVVADAFTSMEGHMSKYDADRSRRLDLNELHNFFNEQWPDATSILDQILPLFTKVKHSISCMHSPTLL